MSHIATDTKPGRVVIVPAVGKARGGARKNFGALCWIEGNMMICIGYTDDGKEAVYAPFDTMRLIRGAVKQKEKKMLYKVLKRLIQHYEITF